jgi:hypothetical protein
MPSAENLMRSMAVNEDSAYVVSCDFKLLSVNRGFEQFARDNGGVDLTARWLGRSILEAIPEPLRAFYTAGFDHALGKNLPWQHAYECSAPDAYRLFHMVVYPVDGPCLVTVHSRVVQAPHTEQAATPDPARYATNGIITMCAHCRRVRNVVELERWDWVPHYLRKPPANLSHGLCGPCCAYHWGWAPQPGHT